MFTKIDLSFYNHYYLYTFLNNHIENHESCEYIVDVNQYQQQMRGAVMQFDCFVSIISVLCLVCILQVAFCITSYSSLMRIVYHVT